MKTYKLINTLLSTSILLCFATSLHAQQGNFAGDWVRNDALSDTSRGISLKAIPINLTIVQNASTIQVARVVHTYDNYAYTESYKLSGELSVTTVKPGVQKKSTLLKLPNEKAFEVDASYHDDKDNSTYSAKEHWSLSENGKRLVIKVDMAAGSHVYYLTEVFDLKP